MQPIQSSPVYFWKPNPGGQLKAWTSLKDIVFISGGNRSGKSTLLCYLAAATMLPHPTDKEYSLYPCKADWDQLDPFVNEETEKLRLKRKVTLPAIVWFSTKNMSGHKDVAMRYFPELFDGYIEKEEWSDEPGVWSRVVLTNGSELHLKSAGQGLGGFQRSNIDLMINDEPFPNTIYGEQLARLLDRHGRMIIGATAVTSTMDTQAYRESEWLIETFAEPAKRGELPPNVEQISIPLAENPHVDSDYADAMYEMLPDVERRARLHGEMITLQGECFFNRDVINDLSKEGFPPEVGYVNDELEFVPDEYRGKLPTFKIWQHPQEGMNYMIGVDPSSGGADPSCCRVWSDNPKMLVAELRGWVSEDQLAHELSNLCKYYGKNTGDKRLQNVMVAIEVNQGRLTLSAMQHGNTELGVTEPLPRIYYRPKPTHLSRGLHFPSDQPGFQTTPASRSFLLSSAQNAIIYASVSDNVVMPDISGFQEDYNWFIWQNGKPQAKTGYHDDRVIADGLAWLGFRQNIWKDDTPETQDSEQVPFEAKDNSILFNPSFFIKEYYNKTPETDGMVYG